MALGKFVLNLRGKVRMVADDEVVSLVANTIDFDIEARVARAVRQHDYLGLVHEAAEILQMRGQTEWVFGTAFEVVNQQTGEVISFQPGDSVAYIGHADPNISDILN